MVEEFARRRAAIAEALLAHGSPGLQRRSGTRRERGKSFGRERFVDIPYDAEAAWPIGKHRLRYDTRGVWKDSPRDSDCVELYAGLTPSGRVVALSGHDTRPYWFNDWDADRRVGDALSAIAMQHGVPLPVEADSSAQARPRQGMIRDKAGTAADFSRFHEIAEAVARHATAAPEEMTVFVRWKGAPGPGRYLARIVHEPA